MLSACHLTVLQNRQRAHASRSRCQPHRTRESRRRAIRL